jgi:dephospho-CoA kinase
VLRIGLTGGIGAGKSAVAARLEALGAVVVDADAVAREVVAPGTEGLAEAVAAFGPDVLRPDGGLDRAALATRVFSDEPARRRLEAIIHPRVRARTAELMAAAGPHAVVVNDVPLLVETGLAPSYHLVIVVVAGERARVARLVRDRGMAESEAYARIRAQADPDARAAAADVLVHNDGTLDELRARVEALWRDRLVPYEENLRLGRVVSRPEKLRLVESDPTWPAQYERLAARIRHAAGDRIGRVDHVGSTAVAGLPAKDVIDIQIGVRRLTDAHGLVPALHAAGFVGGHERADEDRTRKWFFGGADPGRVVHLHVREQNSAGWRHALLFRDWLRADPGAAEGYAVDKRRLAGEAGTATEYAAAKDPWVTAALERAERWAAETGWRA